MKKRLIWLCLGMALCLVACNDNGKNNNQGNDEPKVEEVDVTKDPLKLIDDSIAMDENRPDLYLRRASILMSREQVGMAMMDVNKAIQLDPKNVDALLMLSDIYYQMGDESNITSTLNKALEIDPYDARPMVKLAELNLLQQNFKLSWAYLDKALSLSTYNPRAYFVRGMYFIIAQQDTVNALKNFQISSEQDDSFYDPVEQICRIYAVQQPPYALDYIRKAQQQFPDNANARYELALYLQSHGEPEEAVKHYDTLLMMQPDNYMVLFNVGYVNFVYLENNEVALDYFNRALQANPKYLDAYYNKGRVLEQMGKYAQAEEIYKEILKSYPNYQLAVDAINRIQNQVTD